MHKLENLARLAELSPPETLKTLGLRDGMTFADVGAGTGIFTVAAAEMTRAAIYAIDPSEGMRAILERKKVEQALDAVTILRGIEEVPNESVDLALLSTVLHEVNEQEAFLRSIASRMSHAGTLAVIEFHPRETPFGPPPASRLSAEDVLRLAAQAGFSESERFSLGENFYCIRLRLR